MQPKIVSNWLAPIIYSMRHQWKRRNVRSDLSNLKSDLNNAKSDLSVEQS